MSQTGSRLKKTLGNLLLACLNATLILVALCLLIAFLVVKEVDGLTETFAQNIVSVTPLTDEVAAMNETLTGLREDIAALKAADPEDRMLAAIGLETRLDELQTTADAFRGRVEALSDAPGRALDHVIEKTAYELKTGIRDLQTCAPLVPPDPLG